MSLLRLTGAPSRRLALSIALAVSLVLIACQIPRCKPATLPDDGPPIATSREGAQQFLTKITTAAQSGTENNQITLTVTQEEVTSFLVVGAELADQLQEKASLENLEDLADLENLEGLEEIPGIQEWQNLAKQREGLPRIGLPNLSLRLGIEEPEVRFQGSGQVIVRGYARVRNLRQPARIVVAPKAEDGELSFDFVEGQVGRLPLPKGLFDLVAQALVRAILMGQDFAEITRIEVTEGTLTLSGRANAPS